MGRWQPRHHQVKTCHYNVITAKLRCLSDSAADWRHLRIHYHKAFAFRCAFPSPFQRQLLYPTTARGAARMQSGLFVDQSAGAWRSVQSDSLS